MRRVIMLVVLVVFVVLSCRAQINVNSVNAHLKLTDAKYNLDYLILINGIDANTMLEYTGSASVEWKYNIAGSDYSSTQSTIYPEDGVLYLLEENGVVKYAIYVIDYALYKPTLNTLIPYEGDAKCQGIDVELNANIPALVYKDRNGITRTLIRDFKLRYDDVSWNGEEWADTVREDLFPVSSNTIFVKAPLKNTVFMFYGDQWAEDMNINVDTLYSSEYIGIAVQARLIGVVAERDGLNEKDRSSETEIRGSGPLVVDFASRANPISGLYYEWIYWSVDNPDAYTRYTDQDFRHTFRETGDYQVKLIVSSLAGCEYVDSVWVKVLESFIEVPNVFTPNGDGINDEFRVAYKSIDTYKCIVKNRWGRTVYIGDDPTKGWNGKIGSANAAMGTYYYMIIATGTDKDKDGKPIRYKLSGDINLIR